MGAVRLNRSQKENQHWPLFFILGAISASLIILTVTTAFDEIPNQRIAYADLAAVLLTAAAVLITIFGVGIAILSIWGYTQFKRIAENAAIEYIAEQIRSGSIEKQISDKISSEVKSTVNSGEMRQIIRQTLVKLSYSNFGSTKVDEFKELE